MSIMNHAHVPTHESRKYIVQQTYISARTDDCCAARSNFVKARNNEVVHFHVDIVPRWHYCGRRSDYDNS